MRYSCGGFVDSTSPELTRPGWVRQVSGVAVGDAAGVGVMTGTEGVCVAINCGKKAVGCGVEVGAGNSDGEQAVMKMRSVSSAAIHFVA